MIAEIISIGDEITSGKICDSNAAYLSQRLAELGMAVAAHTAVRDRFDEIKQMVIEISRRADVIIVNGGIGPTHDDLTREAVAEAAGLELVEHPDVLEEIKARFAARGIPMPEMNRKQALIPRGAGVLHNGLGTAAGFHVKLNRADVFVIPGVPGEMMGMFEKSVVPLLPHGEGFILKRSLRTFGLGESAAAEIVEKIIDLNGDPLVSFLADGGIISVGLTTQAASFEECLKKIEPHFVKISDKLGDAVFGEGNDTLSDAVARLLEDKRKTAAVAESCTGGLIASLLTDVPGISKWFLEGVVTYSNESKTRLLGVPELLFKSAGAVSEEVARAMAEGERERSGADFAVSTTGIAGPGGGSDEKPVGTVHIAVASAKRTVHQKVFIPGQRLQVKERAAKLALNLLRLELIKN